MTERAKLLNKIHQTEDKIKDTERYISQLKEKDWGKSYIKGEQKKLERYKKELAEFEASYQAFPKMEDVPAIHEYLEAYKQKTLHWIEKCYELYPLQKKWLKNKEEEFMKDNPELANFGSLTYSGKRKFEAQYWKNIEILQDYLIGYSMYDKRYEIVERDIELRYIDFVQKVKNITGKIIDASFLRMGEKGEINGFVEGEKGRAKVETFGAGGWNIQRFHYRTKVTDITPKEERR